MTIPSPDDLPGITIHDAIQRHLRDCGKCQDAIKLAPNTIKSIAGGRKPAYCSEYFAIFQRFADWERDINKGLLISQEQFIDETRDRRRK